MDLESPIESVEDNEVIALKQVSNLSGTSNNLRVSGDELTQSVSSSLVTILSPQGSIELSPPATAKGYGLKKWRRIRRDVNQGRGSSAEDISTVVKRGLSTSKNSIPNLRKTIVKTVAKDSLHNNLAVGRSSAAKNRMDHHASNSSDAVVENSNWYNKSKMRSPSGKNLGNSFEQKGKGNLETSKKARGRVKIEKKNFHSSYAAESDSRSLNFVSMQQAGTNSGTSNGRRSANYDRDNNSDEVQGVQQSFVEGGSFREDVDAELSSEKIKEGEFENYGSSMERDSLVDSITMLESAQEALQKEIQKLREIGKEDNLALFDDLELNFPNLLGDSADLSHLSEVRPDSPHSLESRMVVLQQNASILESNLEEAKSSLEVKEAKVIELEATLNSSHSSRGSSCSQSARKSTRLNIELQQGEDKDKEALVTELESLFKKKIETEVEYLVISRTIQNLRFAAVGQMKLLEDAENKATILKRRAEKLETSCCTAADFIVDTGEVFKLQKRLCKLTACFFIQLILLVVVVGLCVLQLSPPYVEDVVPT